MMRTALVLMFIFFWFENLQYLLLKDIDQQMRKTTVPEVSAWSPLEVYTSGQSFTSISHIYKEQVTSL